MVNNDEPTDNATTASDITVKKDQLQNTKTRIFNY